MLVGESIEELFEVMKKDRKYSHWSADQTFKTRLEKLLDEVNEIIEATEKEDIEAMKDEMGDIFLDLLAAAVIAENAGLFRVEDSVKNAIEKLRRRKPHIFAEKQISLEEEKEHYLKVKDEEKLSRNQ